MQRCRKLQGVVTRIALADRSSAHQHSIPRGQKRYGGWTIADRGLKLFVERHLSTFRQRTSPQLFPIFATTSVSLITALLCGVACVAARESTYPTSLSQDVVNDAIATVFEHREGKCHCLRVFGEPAGSTLTRTLAKLGQQVHHCARNDLVYRVTGVEATAPDEVSVDVWEDGGPLDTWAARHVLLRDDSGALRYDHVLGLSEP